MPSPLQRGWVSARLVVLALLALLATAAGQGARAPGPDPLLAPAAAEIVAGSNAFRVAQGRLPTRPVAALDAAAREFAQFMARSDRYGHNADDREPAERATAQGYAYCVLSENIAYQFNSRGFESAEALARRFVQGWIDSPGHRRNLLAPGVTETGVAIARSARSGRYYAVQMFGHPSSARWRFEIENLSRQAVRYRIDERRYALPPGTARWHEQCAAVSLRIALPGQPQPLALQPGAGARYRVEAAGGSLRVRGG
jgi:uncharacterized protein YkwD